MGMFDGKVALVTGGASGIGRTTAVAFAKEGAKVAICGRRAEEGAGTVRLIEAAGAEGLFVRCDVTRAAEVEAMVAQVENTFGRLDFAYNNSGIGSEYLPLAEQNEADFDRVIATNLKGVWLSMKHQIPALLRAGGGAIVNCSSLGGLVGLPGLAIYVATKHGVEGLTKSAAMDYARQGIRINTVCPGIVVTEMVADRMGFDRATETASSLQPIGRPVLAEEIAAGVLYLCSPGAAAMTGQHLSIDGGRTATC